ncbi:MAG: DNA polymerase III subunit delta' [Bacteroidales bacterium]|nr:DNA polymerase III subunit delta' [Bacteroidales bacterium]
MQFKDIIGQKNIKENLLQTVKDNRIAHALLFYGPEGSGALPLAVAYAQYISCLNRTGNDSCGTCTSCHKYNKLIHPDLHFVYPVSTSKRVVKDPVSDDYINEWRNCLLQNPYMSEAQWYEFIEIENKQGLIGREESRQILKKLNLKSFESDYKIMIIWLPEKMNPSCANTLLKLIEEPPDNTVLLLVADFIHEILPTILSRVQIIKVPRIHDDDLRKVLTEKHQLPQARVENLLHLSNGSYQRALELINSSGEMKYFFHTFGEFMRAAYKGTPLPLLKMADELSEIGREQQKRFFDYALGLIRQNFVMNFKQPEITYISDEELNFSQRFHPFINQRNVKKIYNLFNVAYRDIEANGYDKIIFLDLGIKLSSCLKN